MTDYFYPQSVGDANGKSDEKLSRWSMIQPLILPVLSFK